MGRESLLVFEGTPSDFLYGVLIIRLTLSVASLVNLVRLRPANVHPQGLVLHIYYCRERLREFFEYSVAADSTRIDLKTHCALLHRTWKSRVHNKGSEKRGMSVHA